MGFDIRVAFSGGLSETQRKVFTLAAARWGEVISADVPGAEVPGIGHVDDLHIDASGVSIDGELGILAQAGPTLIRPDSLIPIAGVMSFDAADLAAMENDGSLFNVIVHEMGHVLGIGTLWGASGFDLIQGSGTDDPVFTGEHAIDAYAALTGTTAPVPVANTGGPGTREGHWRESVFNNELMTGFLDGGTNPLSRLTIASLEDLGYEVDMDAADPYALPGAIAREAAALMKRRMCCIERPEMRTL